MNQLDDIVYRRNLYPIGFLDWCGGRLEALDSLEALMHNYEAPEGDELDHMVLNIHRSVRLKYKVNSLIKSKIILSFWLSLSNNYC